MVQSELGHGGSPISSSRQYALPLRHSAFMRACSKAAAESMIPKSMSSTPIGDGYRFSEKIMLKQKARAQLRFNQEQ
jgi:hypothetical protein